MRNGCSRCGRDSHSVKDGFARTNVNGQALDSFDSESDSSESDHVAPRTLPKIVTQEHTSMAFLCDRLFNIFLLYNCFIESDNFSPFTTLLYIQIDNTTRTNHVILSGLIDVSFSIIFN